MMNDVVRFLLFVPLQLLVFFGVPYWLWRHLKRGKPDAFALPIAGDCAGGQTVPVKATFVGVRGLGWIALANNSLNPRLIITPAGMTFRVLRTQSRRFAEIAQVDVRTLGATVLLSFTFRDTPFTFDANVGNVDLAVQTLAMLPRDVVRTERAAELAKPRQ